MVIQPLCEHSKWGNLLLYTVITKPINTKGSSNAAGLVEAVWSSPCECQDKFYHYLD